ncbi:DUF2945 domain-containing protein [Hyphococcus sp.]|uniref:DUF2945 domain-containing protein n=1 Tax=Hyphococcus sp. TaxID=2038636 RepID=UPI003CCBEA4B
MRDPLETGDMVEWDWGEGSAKGKITAIHTDDITKTIKGTEIKREATAGCPAYTIEQSDGGEVLKSRSEVRPV